jgi:putative MATE family efflux protein
MVEWLAGLLFGFIGTGATALVSRHAGAGDVRGANHFANQSIGAALWLGLGVAAFILLGAPVLPAALGWEAEPSRIARLYFHVDGWGYAFFAMTAIGNACWRGVGDTRTPLLVMSIVNVINICLSTLLRYGAGPIPELGVLGIIIGTLVARVLGGVLVLSLMIRGRSGLQLHRSELRSRSDSMRRVLRVGVPAGIDGGLLWAGQFVFLVIISRLATGAEQAAIVAAHFVGIKIEALSYLPAFAWATAASTLVGQSLGARRPDRAMRSGHLAAFQGALLCLVMGVVYFVFAPQIYAAFNNNPDLGRVSEIGVPALRLLSFFQVPLALTIIYTNALRGAGDTRYPLLFSIIGMGLVRLPLAYAGGILLQGGLIGAWTGMCADLIIRALLSGIRFARGRWQRIAV